MDALISEKNYYGEVFCIPCDRIFRHHAAAVQHLANSSAHNYCLRCDRNFINENAKDQHLVNSSRHNQCHLSVCQKAFRNGGDFETRAELLQHFREDRDHEYCFSCNLEFRTRSLLLNHWKEAPDHYICDWCKESFASYSARQAHHEAFHFVCHKCERAFVSEVHRQQHFQNSEKHHWCSRCERHFGSATALTDHKEKSSNHFMCKICRREFAVLNELVQHQKVHTPRTIHCNCPSTFESLSALVIHWEAGKCTTNRQTLNQLMLKFPERQRFIVTEYINHLNGTEDRIRNCDESDYSYMENAWVCPILGCGSHYPSSAVLGQHLASPYHDVKAFMCPDADCDMRFSCLSALLQHVENSSLCYEGINQGTGSLGRLWLFLLKRFQMPIVQHEEREPHGIEYPLMVF